MDKQEQFHHLAEDVFELVNGEFGYDDHKQIEKLKKFSPKSTNISKQALIETALFFCSTFTVNFCEIEKRLRNGINRPYFLLVVGGGSWKAATLKIILEKWKVSSVLVISDNIAERL